MSNKVRKIKKNLLKDSVIKYPDASLFRESEFVTDFDSIEIANLAAKLIKINSLVNGIALAAPQIGIHKRVCYYITPDNGEGLMINPEILDYSEHTVTMSEGCLSIPGWYWQVSRPASVKIRWNDHNGSEFEGTVDGILGRVVQHEIDHFNGILLPDHFDDETFEQFTEGFFENGLVGHDGSSNIIKVEV